MGWLVLTRKVNERIVCDNGVIVQLVSAGPGKARISIHAPRGVRVMREELLTADERRRAEALARGEATR